jgi:hypothetical protein
MSVLFNTSTDKLQGSPPAYGTANWFEEFWVRWTSGAGGVWSLSPDDVPNSPFLSLEITSGGVLQLFSQFGGSGTSPALTSNAWYHIAIPRNTDGDVYFVVLDDSTSTTAFYDGSGDPASIDETVDWGTTLRTFGTAFGNSAPLMEIASEKSARGVILTASQQRTESQFHAIQIGGGTNEIACFLSNTDADSEGLNDTVGTAQNLTNTGCVNGATHPGQLETLSSSVNVTPGVCAVTITGFAPTPVLPRTVTPAQSAVTITGFAPTVTTGAGAGVQVTPGVCEITITGLVPRPQLWLNIPIAQTQSFVAEASAFEVVTTPGVCQVTITGLAPSFQTTTVVIIPVCAVTITGFPPTVTAAVQVTPGVCTIQIQGYRPIVNGDTGYAGQAAGATIRRQRASWWRGL